MKVQIITIRSSFIILLSIRASSQCPPEVLLKPCRCDDSLGYPEIIVCSNITDIGTLHEVFENSGDWPFTSFTLEFSNLMYIPAEAVTAKSMHEITIKNSTLTSLFDVSPSINNTLNHLKLFDVKFQRGIRWELMSNLLKLDLIQIEASEFRKLGKDFSNNVWDKLKQFLMEGTKTSTLDDNVFAKMKDLKVIRFRHSKISELKRSMFANPSTLLVFDFSGNRIVSLPDDMFDGMVRIHEISLQGNLIKYFSESVFGGHMFDEVIMYFYLQDNPLVCDCSIRWFVNKERYVTIDASCAAPVDKKNLHVRELDPKWFDYCRARTNTMWEAIE